MSLQASPQAVSSNLGYKVLYFVLGFAVFFGCAAVILAGIGLANYILWSLTFFLFLGLAMMLKFIVNKELHSAIVSAFSTLSLNIGIFIILGGLCFKGFQPPLPSWLPYAVLGILALLYIISIINFLRYFGNHKDLIHTYRYLRFNFLKGFGGDTFSEFANSMGLLVAVGIYQSIDPNSGTYWWSAQVASLIAVMSSASYVQRYVLEKPRFPQGTNLNDTTDWDYLKMAGPNLLGSISTMLAALSILIPTHENVIGMLNATERSFVWVIVFVVWLLLIVFWLLSAWIPHRNIGQHANWPKNYFSSGVLVDVSGVIWNYRNRVSLFLKIILWFGVGTALVLVAAFINTYVAWTNQSTLNMVEKTIGGGWYNTVGTVFAFIATALLPFGMLLKWGFDSYTVDDRELKMFMIFKDIAVMVGAVTMLFGLISPPAANGWENYYYVILGINAFAFLVGILGGAYTWSNKPGYLFYPTGIWDWVKSWFNCGSIAAPPVPPRPVLAPLVPPRPARHNPGSSHT